MLIESEQDRREEQEQQSSFIDADDGKTVTINGKDLRDLYEETEWIDEDIDYIRTEGGVIRTIGTKDNINRYINNVLTREGDIRISGREERVKFLRAYLSVSETGGEVRQLRSLV